MGTAADPTKFITTDVSRETRFAAVVVITVTATRPALLDNLRSRSIVEVIGEYRPDVTDEKGRFGLVDVKAIKDVPNPVTLAAVKADAKLKEMVLVKNTRLSVQPVNTAEWKRVCAMGGVKA